MLPRWIDRSIVICGYVVDFLEDDVVFDKIQSSAATRGRNNYTIRVRIEDATGCLLARLFSTSSMMWPCYESFIPFKHSRG